MGPLYGIDVSDIVRLHPGRYLRQTFPITRSASIRGGSYERNGMLLTTSEDVHGGRRDKAIVKERPTPVNGHGNMTCHAINDHADSRQLK